MNLDRRLGIQVRRNGVMQIEDTVCVEDTFRLYLNGEPLVELVASPEQLRELGAGFVVCERLAQDVDRVAVSGNTIVVSARVSSQVEKELRSGSRLSMRRPPRKVNSSFVTRKEDIFGVVSAIESEVWRQTGGTHCSVLFSSNNVLVESSDVGRRNTVDKAVGYAILNGLDVSASIIGCSGRQPAAMVSRVANAGIPIIVSKGASTDKGISTAEEAGITLICFARDGRFTAYTHPHRVHEISDALGSDNPGFPESRAVSGANIDAPAPAPSWHMATRSRRAMCNTAVAFRGAC